MNTVHKGFASDSEFLKGDLCGSGFETHWRPPIGAVGKLQMDLGLPSAPSAPRRFEQEFRERVRCKTARLAKELADEELRECTFTPALNAQAPSPLGTPCASEAAWPAPARKREAC